MKYSIDMTGKLFYVSIKTCRKILFFSPIGDTFSRVEPLDGGLAREAATSNGSSRWNGKTARQHPLDTARLRVQGSVDISAILCAEGIVHHNVQHPDIFHLMDIG